MAIETKNYSVFKITQIRKMRRQYRHWIRIWGSSGSVDPGPAYISEFDPQIGGFYIKEKSTGALSYSPPKRI